MSKSKISRDQVLAKYQQVENEIDRIKNLPTPVYVTGSKYLPAVGIISEIETRKGLIKAMAMINKENEGLAEAAAELGEEVNEKELTIQGISVLDWKNDVKRRIAELNNSQKLVQLKAAKKVLKKHLSEDDLFALETGSIIDILDELPDSDVQDEEML